MIFKRIGIKKIFCILIVACLAGAFIADLSDLKIVYYDVRYNDSKSPQ